MAPASKTVCVMDASGQLGSGLVRRLLERGYWVHAAAQTSQAADQLKMMTMKVGGEDPTRLRVFRSDPLDYPTIVEALTGCSALLYSFEAPFDHPSYDEEMMETEVRAAHNVLEACARLNTIHKVVFTSSANAIIWRDDRQSMESELDEKHWSDVNLCRKFKLWYALSKTVAEKSAWALARDREINMVSINAGLPITPDVSISHPYLQGAAEMYEDGVFVTVDINFLIDAEIRILEDVSAYGRYLCFNNVISRSEDAFKLARKLAPSSLLEPQSFQDGGKLIQRRISNKKLNKLMVEYTTDEFN